MAEEASLPPSMRARQVPLGAVGAAVLVLLLWGWILRFGPLGPQLSSLGSVAELGRMGMTPQGWARLGALAAILVLALARRRPRHLDRASGPLLALLAGTVFVGLTWSVGHLIGFAVAAAVLAAVLALATMPGEPADPSPETDRPKAYAWVPWALWAGVAGVHAFYAMHRHWWFGSGSWDLGCMVHNFHLASRGLDTVSSVLGGVDFLGDHFMVGIYLFSPLFWLDDSAWMVLGVQAVSLAATAPAVWAVAWGRGAEPPLAASLAIATGLGFGLQSAAYFDAHAITVGLGFLAGAIWAYERGRLALATVFLVVLSSFKESLGAYVVGFGLLALFEAARSGGGRRAAYGLGWIVYGTVCFVVVNRVVMPAFALNGVPPESHETFADFGPDVFSALRGMVMDPGKAIGALFVPDAKVQSLGVTLIGVGGGLALLAPEVGIAALPLLAERFLSSKASMWEMGYHYAAPLTLYAGWATARALPRVETWVTRVLDRLHPGGGRRTGTALAVLVLVILGLVNTWGYRHPANYHVWTEPYFSIPVKRRQNAAAVRFVDQLGSDLRVAAQNRILPHLADRAEIWRLGDHARADVVVLSIGESAWPYPDAFPARLAGQLERDPEWARVFVAGTAQVWARGPALERARAQGLDSDREGR